MVNHRIPCRCVTITQEMRQKAHRIRCVVGNSLIADQFRARCQQIDQTNRRIANRSSGDTTCPSCNEGDTVATFVDVCLVATIDATRVVTIGFEGLLVRPIER